MSNITKSISLPLELMIILEERVKKRRSTFSKEITLIIQKWLDIESCNQDQNSKRPIKLKQKDDGTAQETLGENVGYIDRKKDKYAMFWDRHTGRLFAFYTDGTMGIENYEVGSPEYLKINLDCILSPIVQDITDLDPSEWFEGQETIDAFYDMYLLEEPAEIDSETHGSLDMGSTTVYRITPFLTPEENDKKVYKNPAVES